MKQKKAEDEANGGNLKLETHKGIRVYVGLNNMYIYIHVDIRHYTIII